MKYFWKKPKFWGIILIFIALLITIYTMFFSEKNTNLYSNKIKNESIKKEENTEKESITEESVSEEIVTETPKDDIDLSEEVIASSDNFKVTGLNKEVLNFIDNKQKEFADNIYQYAMEYSYLDVTEAVFYGEITINYTQNTVLVNVYLKNEEYTKLEVIYDKRNNTFTTQPW